MAIRLEFCNMVVSIDEIEAKYPRGFRGYKNDYPDGLSWHDGVLLRLGTMNGCPMPTEDILKECGINCYDFASPLPDGWFMYDNQVQKILSSCNSLCNCGAFMWTDQAPSPPEYYEGRYWQGGFSYPNLKEWSLLQKHLIEQNLPGIKSQYEKLGHGYLDADSEGDSIDLLSFDVMDAIRYIGVNPEEFELCSASFIRPECSVVHGISHIYRVMIAVALLAKQIQKPREGLLAFCAAYVHDLARLNDNCDPEHGIRAVNLISRYTCLWQKYRLSEADLKFIEFAVALHNKRERVSSDNTGNIVVELLKDADALDRVRFRNFGVSVDRLRYQEARYMIDMMSEIYRKTRHIDYIGVTVRLDRFLSLLR